MEKYFNYRTACADEEVDVLVKMVSVLCLMQQRRAIKSVTEEMARADAPRL